MSTLTAAEIRTALRRGLAFDYQRCPNCKTRQAETFQPKPCSVAGCLARFCGDCAEDSRCDYCDKITCADHLVSRWEPLTHGGATRWRACFACVEVLRVEAAFNAELDARAALLRTA